MNRWSQLAFCQTLEQFVCGVKANKSSVGFFIFSIGKPINLYVDLKIKQIPLINQCNVHVYVNDSVITLKLMHTSMGTFP